MPTAPAARGPSRPPADPAAAALREKRIRLFVPGLLATFMSFVVTAVITAVNLGVGPGYPGAVLSGWSLSLPVAFCAVYIAAPIARVAATRIVDALWR